MKRPLNKSIVFTGLLLFSMLVPEIVRAQSVEQQISKLDVEIDEIAMQRSNVRNQIKQHNQFAKAAGGWFDQLDHVLSQIQELEQQKRSGNFNIFDNRQLDDQLNGLYSQRDRIKHLGGGMIIQNIRYSNLEQLQAALNVKTNEILKLNRDYMALTADLNAKDKNRDLLADTIERSETKKLQSNKKQLQLKKEDFKETTDLVNDNDLWCLKNPIDSYNTPSFMTRRMAITYATDKYIKELKRNGQSYNPQELARRIKIVRDQSNEVKNALRQVRLPELQHQIMNLEAEIQKTDRTVPDIVGCWIILLGNSASYPTVNVRKNSYGEYDGVIVNNGQLANIRNGHRLFSVTRINNYTYDGTEYSYSRSGQPTRVQLRLIMSNDQLSMNYRSDQVLSLRRCD
ncbi:MAG: hypothetical protein ABIJ31_01085 [Pseudomonadota bacterium]